MASYFELPPQKAKAAVNIQEMPEHERKRLGGNSFLSPAVAQLLEDLGDDESDSGSDERSLSGEEHNLHRKEPVVKTNARKTRVDKERASLKPTKSSLSPAKGERSPTKKAVHLKPSSARAGGNNSGKPTQPHMARFHSLRSMLFSSTIEDKLKNCPMEQVAAEKWKSQHEQRQLHSRPKTPEKDASGKDQGLGSRLKTKLRRMTSKEVPTMQTLNEDGGAHDFSDHSSTASSVNEVEPYRWKPREADESSIDHSDVEELVRWVSRRDPPSDGEARKAGKAPVITITKEDSGHESLGNSDVEDLVKWVSRKPGQPEDKPEIHTGYSDASTESDSEMGNADQSSEDEDVDDLVRWVSRREGPNAGPILKPKQTRSKSADADDQHSSDSHAPRRGRETGRPAGTTVESGGATEAQESLIPPDEPERGRPRSRDAPPRPKAKGHLTNEDVDELVQWVSRKDAKSGSPRKHNESPAKCREREADQEEQPRTRNTDDAASDSDDGDDEDLLAFMKPKKKAPQTSEPTVQVAATTAAPAQPGMGETGELRRLGTSDREARKPAAQEHLDKNRHGNIQMDDQNVAVEDNEKKAADDGTQGERGSLQAEDVDELVDWVSKKS